MTDIEMLPCPWCGGSIPEVTVSKGSTFRWRKVLGCCTDGPEVRHDTLADDQRLAEAESRDRAIAAWNDRAAAAKDAEIEALRAKTAVTMGVGAGEAVAFEAWARPLFYGAEVFDRIDGRPGGWEYNGNKVQAAWAAWQMRASLTHHPAPVAPVGVETLVAQWKRDAIQCKADGYTDAAIVKLDCAQQLAALAQQPAAVNEAVATASDRDLLKMVASATGLTWRKDIEEERAAKNVFGLWITNPDGSLGNTAWNPLHSGSDAFYLAVSLGISVCVRGDAAATRRAIVHAALGAQQGGAK